MRNKNQCPLLLLSFFVLLLFGCAVSSDSGGPGASLPIADSWQSFTIIKPTSLNPLGIKLMGTKLIMWGGFDGTSYYNTGEIFDLSNSTWQTMSTTFAPAGGSWFENNARFFNVCGLPSSAGGAAYDVITDSWQVINNYKGCAYSSKREKAFFGNKSFVGASTGLSYSILDSALATYNSSVVVQTPSALSGAFLPVVSFNESYVYNWDGLQNQGYYFDTSNVSVLMPAQAIIPPRTFVYGAAVGNRVYYWGGYLASVWQTDGIVFDKSTGIWSSMGTSQGPPGPPQSGSIENTSLLVSDNFPELLSYTNTIQLQICGQMFQLQISPRRVISLAFLVQVIRF
jgi:hypothetical protein